MSTPQDPAMQTAPEPQSMGHPELQHGPNGVAVQEPPRINLFAMADANAGELEQRVEAVRNGLDQESLERAERFFAQVQTDGRICVNMRPWILSRFLTSGNYRTIYDWDEDMADIFGGDPQDYLAAKLGDYYNRRKAFDATFLDGEQFRYGALTIGGAGAEGYGQFCFVTDATFPEDGWSTFLRGDSLNHYTGADGEVLFEQLRCDVAPPSHRGHLATLKHSDDLATAADWAAMLCSSQEYIEAIFLADLKPEHGEQIRVGQAGYNELMGLVFASFAGGLSDADKALLEDFKDILREAKKRSIAVVEVPTC